MATGSNEEFTTKYGSWALVAGAAEGIGEGFSEALAKRGMNLIMADLNGEVQHVLSDKLKKTYPIETREIALDLSSPDAWRRCMEAVDEVKCRLMVYVPAYSRVKPFMSTSGDELDRYLDLNARTPIHLVHSFIASAGEIEPAGIILMSSLAGLIGTTWLAPYSATKAFNILLAESLASEFRGSNISIAACCAGQTSTPAYWSSNPSSAVKWPPVMSPAEVAEYAIKNLGRKTIIMPGWQNRFSYFLLTRIFSRKTAAGFLRKSMKRIYRINGEVNIEN